MNESEEIMDRENTLAINLQGICKSFSVGKRKVEVLKKVDVSINSGELVERRKNYRKKQKTNG